MQDIRDALRALRSTPVVTVVAILSLALGIGANTAIFSIVESLTLRTLPVRDPARLALVTQEGSRGPINSWTYPIWEELKSHEGLFEGVFAWSNTRFNLADHGRADLVDGVWASGRYFEVLGVPAILGRTFSPRDDERGGGPDGPVAVISYAFWQQRFNGAPDAVGRVLTIERVPFTVVGVLPPEFFGVDVGRRFDVAVPFGTEPLIRGRESALERRSMWWLTAMVRLAPDQSLEAGTAALRGVQPQIREATLPEHIRPQDVSRHLESGFTLAPAATGSSFLRARYQRPLLTMMVVVGLVLLIACANIANLLLARAAARRHEVSVRLALGASRGRLFRQFGAESLLLAGAGAAAGLLFAMWGSRLLVRQLSTQTSTVFLDLSPDWRVLAFTAGVALVTALIFGTAPALGATRVRPNEALKEHARSVAGDGRLGPGNLLVVVQVALSLVLVVAAGLFVRTFASLASLDLGFERDQVLVVNVNAQRKQLDDERRVPFFEGVLERAQAVPGVGAAALSMVTPVSGSTWMNSIEVPDGPELPEDQRSVHLNMVSPDWFRVYGTRLVAGRDFGVQDGPGAPRVAIVNLALARRFFDGADPIGRRIVQPGFGNTAARDFEIVGLVSDAVYRSLREPPPPTLYLPFRQGEGWSSMSLSVRAAGGPPALLTRPLADALTEMDRDLALTFRPLADQVNASLVQERVVAMLSGFFGALALLLAGLGLYGITSYAVNRRRAEIGIRMALGADARGVVGLVLRRVGLLVGLGVVLGSAASLWAASFVETLVYGLQPRDPATLTAAAAVLAATGALAGWLPARRAARIDPAEVLREI